VSATEQNTTLSLSGSIVSVQVGHVAPLGPRRAPSAFVKDRSVAGSWFNASGWSATNRQTCEFTAVPTKQSIVTQSSTTPNG